MRAIQIVTTRLSSCLRPIRFEFLSSSSSPRLFSNPRRLICTAAATKSDGGRSGSIVAPLVENEEEVQKIDVNPPKGTRDFAPDDMRLRNWLFNHFKEVYLNLQKFEFCYSFDRDLNSKLLCRYQGYSGMKKWIIQCWRRKLCSSEKQARRLETK